MSQNFYHHKTINGVKKTVHRHVMEEHIGRELESNEHVYHIDGDSTNNKIENLIIITKNVRNGKTKKDSRRANKRSNV